MGFEFFKNRPKSFPIQVNEKARLGLWTVRVGEAEKFFFNMMFASPQFSLQSNNSSKPTNLDFLMWRHLSDRVQ